MKLLILIFAISRLCACSLVVPVPYRGVTVGFTPYSAPVNSHSQYHAQDKYGQYSYGYATDSSAKDEVKTADGVTRGGYSYIDASGILQTVQYISDPVHGFRVAATNLPQDVPAVAAARAQHLAQFEYIKNQHEAIAASRGQYPAVISPVPASGGYIVPVKSANFVVTSPNSIPIAYQPPVVALSSQYQAQDGHGQYSYGYADPNSAKEEVKTADGVTRGGYSYIDANGILQTVQYVSDPIGGFRVAATNLPQAPQVILIGPKVTATVAGPVEQGVSLSQKPIIVEDIVPNSNIPVQVSPGPNIYPNPNNEPIPVVPKSGLPIPFDPAYQYPQDVGPPPNSELLPPFNPIYHQGPVGNPPPVYASAYPMPHSVQDPILMPQYPSSIPHAPVHTYVPNIQTGSRVVPYQYAPQHGIIYDNQNIQVSEGYNSPSSLVVQVVKNPNEISIGQYGNIQLTQNQQAQIYDDVKSQITTPNLNQYALSNNPQEQVYAENPTANVQSQYYPSDQKGLVLTANPYGRIPENSGEQVYAENPTAHVQNQYYPSDQKGLVLTANPYGRIPENSGEQYISQEQILSAVPQSNDQNGQILSDPRGYIAQQDQIPLNPAHGQSGTVEGDSHYLTDGYVGNGPHQINLGFASRDYEVNYPINVDTINNAPINQQVLNHGEGRVPLFSPGQEVQQVQQAPAGGGQVEKENNFVVAGQEGSGSEAPVQPSGYYTTNIQY